MEKVNNKDLDIPAEILFKYLCRDYRKLQTHSHELEKQVSQLQAVVNYGKNCLPSVEKLQKQVANLKVQITDLQSALNRRNITISQLSEVNEKLRKSLEKYE